jgi:hypothetical protein
MLDLKCIIESIGSPLYIKNPPLSKINNLSNILKISDEGWWITTKTNFPFRLSSFSRSKIFSESLDDSPEVGSSKNKMAGSLINSKAMFSLFRGPPLIYLFKGFPTTISLISNKPRFSRTSKTIFTISSFVLLSKQSLAL